MTTSIKHRFLNLPAILEIWVELTVKPSVVSISCIESMMPMSHFVAIRFLENCQESFEKEGAKNLKSTKDRPPQGLWSFWEVARFSNPLQS